MRKPLGDIDGRLARERRTQKVDEMIDAVVLQMSSGKVDDF